MKKWLVVGLVLVVALGVRHTAVSLGDPSSPSDREGPVGAIDSSTAPTANPSLEGLPPREPELPGDARVVTQADGLKRQRSEGKIEGLVREERTNLPVEGAVVFEKVSDGAYISAGMTVRTDALGAFSLPEAMHGASIIVRARGFLPAEVKLTSEASDDPVLVNLQAGAAIAGVVVTPWGDPVPGARVVASLPGGGATWPITSVERADTRSPGSVAVSDSRGAFVLRGLSEGAEYDVRGACKGYGMRRLSHERAVPPARKVRVVLSPEARVVFTADRNRDETGGAAAPNVEWFPTLIIPGTHGLSSIGSTYWFGGKVGEERFLVTRPTEHGARIPLRYYFLTLHGTRTGEAEARVGRTTYEALDLGASGSAKLQLLATVGSGRPYSGRLLLRIRRVEVNGELLARVRFVEGRAASLLSLEPGEYVLSGVKGGDLSSGFWTPFPETTITLTGGLAEQRLTMSGGSVRVKVVDAGGSPVHGFALSVSRGGGLASGWISAPVSEDAVPAAYEVWLPRGEHVLAANVPEVGRGSAAVSIGADSAASVVTIKLDSRKAIDFWKEARKMRARR